MLSDCRVIPRPPAPNPTWVTCNSDNFYYILCPSSPLNHCAEFFGRGGGGRGGGGESLSEGAGCISFEWNNNNLKTTIHCSGGD